MGIEAVEQRLKDHISSDEKSFKNISDTMGGYKRSLDEIKDNHLAHIKEDIIGIKSDIKWIKIIGGVLIVNTLGILTKLLFG